MKKKLLIGLGAVIVVILTVVVARMLAYDPEIHDWHDLHAVRDNMEGNHRLMNNLDAASAGYEELAGPMANQGKGWEPIGYWDLTRGRGRPFMGVFDGQGYEIRDLYIDRPDEDTVGLFGAVAGFKSVEEGIVANARVVAANVTGGSYVGALVGYNHIVVSQPGTVNNCYATGSVTGHDYVGGLVGWNVEGTVSGSRSVTSVTGHDYVGGLVGWNGGTGSGSYSVTSVTGRYSVGGLVGLNERLVGFGQGVVSNSFWDVETSAIDVSDGGIGKTTAEMMDIATFTDTQTEGLEEAWDITAVAPDETNLAYIWNIVDDETYPFLSWQ